MHVDDDPSLLEISKQILMDIGAFEIDHVYSVDEAFSKLSTKSYDAVVSDYEMPAKNGLQFLKELREQKNDIPFIMFTGKGREEVIIDALNLGADRYVNKNGNPETIYFELAHAINVTVEQKRSKAKIVLLEDFGERVIDSISDPLIVIDPVDYKIIDANKASLEQLKSVREELIGKTCFEATHHRLMPCASPQDICSMEEAIKTGKPSVVVHRHFDMNNKPVDVEIVVHPVKDNDGKIVQIIHISKVISECENIAKEKTRESSEVNKILDGIGDLLFVIDKNRIINRINKSTCDALKKKPEELIGKHCYEVMHKTNNPWPNCPAEKTFETKRTATVEINDPNIGVPLLVTTSPILDEQRELIQCVHIAKDITELKKAENALRKSEEELNSLFANMIDGLAYCQMLFDETGKSVDFVYLQINDAFEKITGLKRDLVVGKKVTEAIPGIKEANPELFEIYGRVASTGQKERFEVFFKPLSIWLSISVYCPRKGYFAAIFENITNRKAAEAKLASLKEFDERIIDSLDDALLVIDPDDYRIISTNEVALKQLKLRKEELIGKTCYETTHHSLVPCNSQEHMCPIRRVIETKETIIVEHKHFDENNNERIVEVSARLVKNPEGKTVVIHVSRDITERKQMETRIREAEKRYRALFDQAPVGILIIDPETAVPVEFNEVAHQQLGYTRDEFARLRIFDYKAGETPDETKARIEKILQGGIIEFETKHRTKTGEIRDIVATSQAIELSGKTFVHSIYRDVTEAKKMENALMESEAKYRELVELAQEGVWALDNDNRTVFVNLHMAKMLGYTESEMIGKTLGAFLDKPDYDLAKHNLELCKLGNQGQCEFEFIQKDGARMYANIAASSFQDDEGKSIGTLALVADMTERKKVEISLKESHDKLEMMNEKLSVVGSLTRHDVRNKLSTVTGYAYILKKKHGDQADIVEGLSKMEQAVAESVKIFDFAKMYEQLGVEDLAYINVEAKMNEARALFSGSLPQITNECQGLSVLADSFVRQLFYNFIDNTRKYGKKTTTIRVHYEKADQDNLKLIYEDDGVGVPSENKLRLFKEGFSTGGSTGFGLFLTKKMMDVYGWIIQEVGEAGKGAKFVITIPKLNKNGKENYRIVL
ncbi:MAG: PAS domain S-box protein [Candidatus Bathyarchaeia archaeon]